MKVLKRVELDLTDESTIRVPADWEPLTVEAWVRPQGTLPVLWYLTTERARGLRTVKVRMLVEDAPMMLQGFVYLGSMSLNSGAQWFHYFAQRVA